MAPARWMRVAWPVYTPGRDLVGLEQESLGLATAVLDARDRQLTEHIHGDSRRRHLGVVIGEDGDVHRRGNPLVVGPRVGHPRRGEDEEGVGTIVGGAPREDHGLASGGRARPCDHRHSSVDRRAHREQQISSLLGIERCGLAGAAGDHDRVHTCIDEAGGVVGGGRRVDLALLVEQRDERDAHPGEGSRSGHDRQPNEWQPVTQASESVSSSMLSSSSSRSSLLWRSSLTIITAKNVTDTTSSGAR